MRAFSRLLTALSVLLITGCQFNENPVRTSLEIDETDLILQVGETATRQASTKSTDYQFFYTSSNPAVATVDQNGMVTGISEGEAIITVSMPESKIGWYAAATRSYKVIVKKAGGPSSVKVTSITLNETALTKNLGDAAVTLTATVAPADAVDKSITWTSDNPAVATVNNGEVSIIGLGTAIITAAANDGSGVKATCTVTVKFPGLLAGKFSVSATKQVQFSQGNLQAVIAGYNGDNTYTASSWKFAEHQWDYIGNGGVPAGQYFKTGNTVDLFGWVGNSALRNSYGLCKSSPYNNTDYGGSFGEVLKSDWGTLAITNGGNRAYSGWYTLNKDEWDYLFSTRTTTSGIRYAKATVNNVKGVILLPDDWSASYHALTSADTKTAAYTSNPITAAEWTSDFEAHGAVFLPAAGIRDGTAFSSGDPGSMGGYYWSRSSTANSGSDAYHVVFKAGNLNPSSTHSRHYGCSVRLVKDVE